ncbi:TetR/AcrR family transcriptional regulator [Chitinimonas naiadis]
MPSQNANANARLPQGTRGRQKVALLLDTAATLFAEQGFDATTMTEIAARAEASIGSLYQYFPTKEQVADALLQRFAEQLYLRMEALVETAADWSADDLLEQLYPALIQFRSDNPAFIILAEARSGPPLAAMQIRVRMRHYVQAILRKQAPQKDEAELELLAVLVLQIMKTAAGLYAEPDLPQRPQVLAELKAMLQDCLNRRLYGR